MPVSDATLSTSPSNPQLHCGYGCPSCEQSVHRHVHVTELAGHPGRPLHDPAALDHAAAEAGADDRRDRRPLAGDRAEVHVVGVQRGGVAVVVVDHREAELALERLAHVEPAPALCEVGRTLRADHPGGRRRPGRVEPHADHGGGVDAGQLDRRLERLAHGRDRDVGALGHAARELVRAGRSGTGPCRR